MTQAGFLERWAAPVSFTPQPIPQQAPAQVQLVQVPGARLACWDTGGAGPVVVFVHPATGSAHMWLYQQPVFAAAGYRVIGWSRRGHLGSDPVDPAAPGSASDDLRQVLDHFGVEACHVVAAAAGGAISFDFALSHPQRLRSLTIASSVGGALDPDFLAANQRLRPEGFDALPAEFREIGPSYRAANPAGVEAWRALEHAAVSGLRIGQKPRNRITFAALESLRVPVLLMSGDADLWMPPALTRRYAAHLPAAELLVVPEVGHAIYWEAPATFNAEVLAFIGRHRR